MSSHTFEQLLERASKLCGVGAGFWDIWGRYHETPLEAKQAILRAKGYDATGAKTLERSLAARTRREWDSLLPPAAVVGESDTLELAVNVRTEWVGEVARFRVRAEDGTVTDFELKLRICRPPRRSRWMAPRGSARRRGCRFACRSVTTTLPPRWAAQRRRAAWR